jgi:hypothetical protein
MAHSTLQLENPTTGEIIHAPIGYSWTCFFFGFFVPFVRQDWLAGCVTLALTVLLGPIVNIVFLPFMYNKYYINTKVKEGFVVTAANSPYSYAQLEQKIGIRLRVQPVADNETVTVTTTTTTTVT